MKLAGVRTDTHVKCLAFEEFVDDDFTQLSVDHLENPVLWCLRVPDSEFILEPFFAMLTQEEKTRRDRFKHQGARRQFLTAHIALHIFLNQYLKNDYRHIILKETEHHKPFVELPDGSNPLEFNLSHCKEWIAFIVARHPVGIDIEGHRDFDSIKGVAEMVFTENENDKIFATADTRIPLFYHHWSCKEAFLKACGTGLMQDPKTLEMDFDTERWADHSIVWWTEQIENHSLAWTERPE